MNILGNQVVYGLHNSPAIMEKRQVLGVFQIVNQFRNLAERGNLEEETWTRRAGKV